MNVAIVGIDTRGGIQPYVGLALGLRRAGHGVRMIILSNAVALAAEWGIEAHPLSVDIQALLQDVGVEGGGRTGTRHMRGQMRDMLLPLMAEARDASAGADVVLADAGGIDVGRSVAEVHGIPFVAAYLQPVGGVTAAFPGVFAPDVPRWLGAPGRVASHLLTNALISLPHRSAVQQARTEVLGLPKRFPKPTRRTPVLYGFNPRVIPPPPSWAGRRVFTGYWTAPAPPGWSPPPDLAAFLSAGAPPICFGFGSMPNEDPAAPAELLVAASRRVGRRAVLLSGWGGLEIEAAEDVYVTEAVPHDWLFPRVAAVVHHGGAGTTGAALRAGVPAVVVPNGADQPFWGAQVAALGVGPRPIPRKQLDAPGLAGALDLVLTDRAMRTRAQELGEHLRAEDGVGTAVALLEEFHVA